ncbi:MAG: hypothetical protein ACMXYK_03820 [Candidatus Woesearchaeota archaeon]
MPEREKLGILNPEDSKVPATYIACDFDFGKHIQEGLQFMQDNDLRLVTLPELIQLRINHERPNAAWGTKQNASLYTGTEIFTSPDESEVYVLHGAQLHTPKTVALAYKRGELSGGLGDVIAGMSAEWLKNNAENNEFAKMLLEVHGTAQEQRNSSQTKIAEYIRQINYVRGAIAQKLAGQAISPDDYLKNPSAYAPESPVAFNRTELPQGDERTLDALIESPFVQTLFGGREATEKYLAKVEELSKKSPAFVWNANGGIQPIFGGVDVDKALEYIKENGMIAEVNLRGVTNIKQEDYFNKSENPIARIVQVGAFSLWSGGMNQPLSVSASILGDTYRANGGLYVAANMLAVPKNQENPK